MLKKANACWRASFQRQTWVRNSLAKTASCVLGEISAELRTGASCNHNKTGHHIGLQWLWVCIGAVPLTVASVMVIFFYLQFERGSSSAMRFPCNQVFWRMSPFLAGRFPQAELKSFTDWPGVFQSVTMWGCLGFWKCRSRRERARVTQCTLGTSQAGHAGAAGQKTSWERWEPSWVYGCRLRTSFLYRLAWHFFFFFFFFLLFILYLWGTESTKYTLVEVAFSDISRSPSTLLENKTGASLKP